MIIETHSNVDSRFILYPLAYLLSRMAAVKVYTTNDRFKDFGGEQDIYVEKSEDFVEQVDKDFDYVILDNVLSSSADYIIYFIDPYSGFDLTMLPKDVNVIRVFHGEGKKIQKIKDRTLCTEEDIQIEQILTAPKIEVLPTYEEIYKFENIQHFMNIDNKTLQVFSSLKELFPGGLKIAKGGVDEYTSAKRLKVLW